MQPHTFLWHDYETFGSDPRHARPAQFAAVRTDADLNEIQEPLMLYCQPAPDFLPDPKACLITGIMPQDCLARGLPEYQFAARIEAELAHANTIGVGYNTIRFDDEVTRFMLWRNLMDPYAREWQNGCGRWDLLDVMRAAYALRPEGLEWPSHADGTASFKLGDLCAANGLLHEAAHDALSDVRATIALARTLKLAQPRLFEFCLGLHRKDRVLAELGLPSRLREARPFWHVSGMFGADRGCLALMWPLAMHPNNKNELLAWDLAHNPQVLAELHADEIRQRLFTKATELPAGVPRLPVKSIHLNRSPMVFGKLRVVSGALAKRWGMDVDAQLAHASLARDLPDMSEIWPAVFSARASVARDVDEDLYGGFVGDHDRRRLQSLRQLAPSELALDPTGFDDERLAELVWRYRARNFPQSLAPQEAVQWKRHLQEIWGHLPGVSQRPRTMESVLEEISRMGLHASGRDSHVLANLEGYIRSLASTQG
ncbi:MAG: exodeoxyribonuclease I [Burkholderiales bacterium PBB4]|nr:MAG: exodeoxyribonuclease I [Burkholderiales bacterium PBB4]